MYIYIHRYLRIDVQIDTRTHTHTQGPMSYTLLVKLAPERPASDSAGQEATTSGPRRTARQGGQELSLGKRNLGMISVLSVVIRIIGYSCYEYYYSYSVADSCVAAVVTAWSGRYSLLAQNHCRAELSLS